MLDTEDRVRMGSHVNDFRERNTELLTVTHSSDGRVDEFIDQWMRSTKIDISYFCDKWMDEKTIDC